MGVRLLAACVLLAWAWPAQAQQPVNLQFANGRVTLRAQNAPIRTILAEWARLGGATIVNGDRVTGAPLTLELTDVPERQALDIVLRNVAGYMLGPRRAGALGASAFDRIMILPTSVAPRNPPPAPTSAASQPNRPVLARPVLRQPPLAANDPLDGDVVVMDDPMGSPASDSPFPPGLPQPLIRGPVAVGADAQGEEENAENQPGLTVVGSPTNPFGVPAGSSATPGVISPAPRQPQGGQPNRVQ